MTDTLDLKVLKSHLAIEDMSIQQKRSLAWKLIDEHTPSQGFSRKKLVPLHSSIMSLLSGSEPDAHLLAKIEKVLSDPEPLLR